LFTHQPLCADPILDPDKAVVLFLEADALLPHLARQPFPPVEADLNRKGKPCLNARIHPPQFRMLPVWVHEQAFA
jgi:hypothetical protein